MSYRNVDFNSDKPLQYAKLRKRMSEKYEDYFGKQDEIVISGDTTTEEKADTKSVNNNIKKGYQRVMEKVKDIRQNYSNAVTSSGSRVAVVK